MKYRVRNIVSGNYVSQPVSVTKAHAWCNKLNATGRKYEVVPLQENMEKLSTERKPMSEAVKLAILHLKNIKYASGRNDTNFANVLISRANKNELVISEREEVYLWAIIHHYRRQIDNQKLILTAKTNMVF